MRDILITIIILLIIIIPVSILWVNGIDRALDNDEWAKFRQEEDEERAEYIKRYTERKRKKEDGKKKRR